MEDDELVILDEADYFLFDIALRLNAKYCIGLTATPTAKLNGLESSHLNWM